MLKFISFGSGSSGNCYLLFTPTDALLIDVGISGRMLKKHMKDRGLSLADVHHILVTHDHYDHIKAVGVVSQDYGVPVYATREVHAGIVGNYCVRKKVMPDMQRNIEKDRTLQVGEFEVTPFGVPHDSSDNVGYRVRCGGVCFCLITDAGCVTAEMKPFIAEADYLVIEANHDEQMLAAGPYPAHLKKRILSPTGHLSNKNCAAALVENATDRLRHVWLCHLSEENNHPELARLTVQQALNEAGSDVKVEVLRRTVPSEIYELT